VVTAISEPKRDVGRPGHARSLYFVNSPVDFFFIGGASIVTFLLLRGFHGGRRTPAVLTTAMLLTWVVNWPHFSATSFRLYRSRATIRQYPLTAVAVPILLAAGSAAALASPELLAPAFVHIFLLWSPYHFSGQSVGISLLYARRAGLDVGRFERFVLSAFVFGTFVMQTARAEVAADDRPTFYGVSYPTLGLPPWAADVATYGLWISAAAFLVVIAIWCVRARRLVPPIVLVPAASQFTWFVLGASWQSYVEFVPCFHALQYLLIAWSMQLKEKADALGLSASRGYVARETLRWGLANVAGGAILFWVLPRAVERTGVPIAFATAVMLAAVQIHHFFVDGVIWKLKNPKVANPLLSNLREASVPQSVVASERAA
jgi:hypothetical protein